MEKLIIAPRVYRIGDKTEGPTPEIYNLSHIIRICRSNTGLTEFQVIGSSFKDLIDVEFKDFQESLVEFLIDDIPLLDLTSEDIT